jgi:hypothetical protein
VFQPGSSAHNPLFDESSVGYGSDRLLHLQAKRLSFAGVVEGWQEAGRQIGQGCLVFGVPPAGEWPCVHVAVPHGWSSGPSCTQVSVPCLCHGG